MKEIFSKENATNQNCGKQEYHFILTFTRAFDSANIKKERWPYQHGAPIYFQEKKKKKNHVDNH